MDIYHLKYTEANSHEEEAQLLEGIIAEAALAKETDPIRSFAVYIIDQKKNLFGGAKGVTYYGCLYIDLLWVHQNLRSQGWGTKLISAAEKIGKERNCTFATVNTMDWEALPFYQSLGYEVEFTREGYQQSSKMFLLRKGLI